MADDNNQSNETPVLEGLILTAKSEPFKDIGAASRRRTELMAENPGEQYSVIGYAGGYALLKTIKTPAEIKAEEEIAARLAAGGKVHDDGTSEFVRVIFDARTDTQEPNDVYLSHNGDPLLIQREQEVIIPRKYLEVADHTLRQKFRQLPGQTRKTIAHVKTYTYRVLGPATREEYERMKREGTKKLEESVLE